MSHSPSSAGPSPTRRDFLMSSAAAAATFAVLPGRAKAAEGGEVLRVGLIGCGGRGTGAARQALAADPNAQLVALGDAFADRIESSLNSLKSAEPAIASRVLVDPGHMFSGFDNHIHVINSCDVVLLAAPPAFRPQHLRAAVEAGKHIFCEKPVAVDAVGVRSVRESSEMARSKHLNLVTGLCYRYEHKKQDTIKRIHDGMIGEILNLQTTYNTGGLWHRGDDPKWSRMEYQMRNWLYFDWLSGDHITEQHIHSLDKIAWCMGNKYPVKATASGGRTVRVDPMYGNIYDHFNTTYEWENGVRCFSSCRQWPSTSTDVSDHLIGTLGSAHLMDHTIKVRGGEQWTWSGEEPDDMYQNEHNALFASIRNGDVINDGEIMCNSTLMAIMGRMSAYTGQTLTWDEVSNSKLDLFPKRLEWYDIETPVIAVPGETEFV
jgi:myo-inositol 2-dehydrogenase/D-chiro-inositol 1-dehydrogenase